MEDSHVIAEKLASMPAGSHDPLVSALLAVFDGHNGVHAAEFASQRILHGVTKSKHFPTDISTSLVEAFVQIDQQYYAALKGCTGESAGTTALAVLVWGTTLYVANAGDSRAVISQSGKAIDLTRDHKPDAERERIESSGGFVCTEGLLNGELGVARAIGDYHMPDLKQLDADGPCPLTAEPEVTTHQLQEGDEFMLLGCDGLWDVFPSQRAVEFARHRLREHNDPQRCAEELVAEALRMHSSDNVTVICCCFGEECPKRRIYGNGRFSRSVSRQGLDCITAALGEQQLQ